MDAAISKAIIDGLPPLPELDPEGAEPIIQEPGDDYENIMRSAWKKLNSQMHQLTIERTCSCSPLDPHRALVIWLMVVERQGMAQTQQQQCQIWAYKMTMTANTYCNDGQLPPSNLLRGTNREFLGILDQDLGVSVSR